MLSKKKALKRISMGSSKIEINEWDNPKTNLEIEFVLSQQYVNLQERIKQSKKNIEDYTEFISEMEEEKKIFEEKLEEYDKYLSENFPGYLEKFILSNKIIEENSEIHHESDGRGYSGQQVGRVGRGY